MCPRFAANPGEVRATNSRAAKMLEDNPQDADDYAEPPPPPSCPTAGGSKVKGDWLTHSHSHTLAHAYARLSLRIKG